MYKFKARFIKSLIFTLASLVILGVPLPSHSEILQSRSLLGMYISGQERLIVRENNGILEVLCDTEKEEEKMFSTYTSFPLIQTGGNKYLLLNNSPMKNERLKTEFTIDAGGNGSSLLVAGKEFQRKFFDVERGRTFKIKPLMGEEVLRKRALAAEPPAEPGEFFKPDLIELISIDPTIKTDIRYATENNFMGIRLYDQPRAFLQREAAAALVTANSKLSKYGYGLIVYDAYRPWYVTKMFYDATPDHQKDFVANPSLGSRHNRGGAVDVGLYELKTGKAIDMGSGYDEFSIRAHPDYPGGTSEQRELRNKLRVIMEGEGFKVFHNEWWHFDYRKWKKYPIMNLRFEEI
ncbi:MAG: M15 family metallopeptidase [Synergistaceae bacterium]|nr:M15 family metallopeptidase [Synergistaceae bacterium]MBP9559645.1 M15 family metallopeptidase [Synergistaceae bacterium]